jgi:MFS family permease
MVVDAIAKDAPADMTAGTARAFPDDVPASNARAFWLLMFGSSFSMLGSRVTDIAYPMLVLYLTRSPLTTGWVACAVVAPSIFAYLPAGVLVDRLDPRRVMLVGEFGRGALVAAVMASLALGRPSVPLIIVAAAAGGILETFSTLAERCYVRQLVAPAQVSSAQARIETRTHAMVLAGRPLGGFLFGLGPIAPFLFDTVSFIISVGAITRIETMSFSLRGFGEKYRGATFAIRRSITAEMQLGHRTGDALRWLRANPFVAYTLLMSASGTLYCQALIMIFLANAHSRQLSPIATGALLAASGVGGAVGSSALASPLKNFRFPWVKFQALSWPIAFFIFAIWGEDSFLLAAVMLAYLGGTGALGNIEVNTCLAQRVDHGMLARITGIGRVLSFAACSLGWALGGLLAQRNEQHAVFALFAITLALPVLSALRPPSDAKTVSYEVSIGEAAHPGADRSAA